VQFLHDVAQELAHGVVVQKAPPALAQRLAHQPVPSLNLAPGRKDGGLGATTSLTVPGFTFFRVLMMKVRSMAGVTLFVFNCPRESRTPTRTGNRRGGAIDPISEFGGIPGKE